MQAEFIRQKNELPDVVSLWFEAPAGFTYSAGDYTELSLGLRGVADRRWLSIASAPSEPALQFTVKINKPPSTYKTALLNLQPGDKVNLSPPMGNFNLPNQEEKLLFVAGGVGVTPYRSLLLQLKQERLQHDIQLLYAAKPKQHLFTRELNAVKIKTNYFSGGNLGLGDIKSFSPDADQRIIYLAGPEPMMTRLHEQFLAEDHPRWRLRLCYFDNYKSV